MAKDFVIPTSPEDIKKLQNAIEEASASLIRQDAEKDLRKEIHDALSEQVDIPKAVFNRMVKVYYKSSFRDDVQSAEDFRAAYEKVMAGKDFTVGTD
jgi:FixJ family two-component response regulator